MKNHLFILIISILALSCRKPSIEGETVHERIIENNSSHSINIKNLYNNEIKIPRGESFEDKFVSEGENPPQVYGYLIPETDSIEVIYDDTLTVYHGSINYLMLRDLRRNDMFNLTESKTNGFNHYTYTYSFTDVDYDEARTK